MKTRLSSMAAALVATAVGAALWAPQARADVAPQPTVDSSLIIIAVAVVGVVIVGAIAWFVLRAVKRGGAPALPAQPEAIEAGPEAERAQPGTEAGPETPEAQPAASSPAGSDEDR